VSALKVSPPPPDVGELHVWVLDTGAQLRALRANLRAALNQYSGTTDELTEVAERMVVVATELAANAIRHGLPPTVVRLSHTDDHFVLDVADHDLASVPELADFRPINAGGRGLRLARALSVDVGWYTDDTAEHVWATFPLHP
jgi:serine/threonine-protein kinase RsbW